MEIRGTCYLWPDKQWTNGTPIRPFLVDLALNKGLKTGLLMQIGLIAGQQTLAAGDIDDTGHLGALQAETVSYFTTLHYDLFYGRFWPAYFLKI